MARKSVHLTISPHDDQVLMTMALGRPRNDAVLMALAETPLAHDSFQTGLGRSSGFGQQKPQHVTAIEGQKHKSQNRNRAHATRLRRQTGQATATSLAPALDAPPKKNRYRDDCEPFQHGAMLPEQWLQVESPRGVRSAQP